MRTLTETTGPAPAPPAAARSSSETTEPALAPPATVRASSDSTQAASAPPATGSADEFSAERLRDYVAAYVLAGLDKNVGAEAEFFADRVDYYDQGEMDREKIQQDLKRYDERWPERHFWVAGKISIEPQSENRVRVTFPLGFKLRNGNKQSSGKVDKTLVLKPAGDDLQIVAVNERKVRLGRINQETRKITLFNRENGFCSQAEFPELKLMLPARLLLPRDFTFYLGNPVPRLRLP